MPETFRKTYDGRIKPEEMPYFLDTVPGKDYLREQVADKAGIIGCTREEALGLMLALLGNGKALKVSEATRKYVLNP